MVGPSLTVPATQVWTIKVTTLTADSTGTTAWEVTHDYGSYNYSTRYNNTFSSRRLSRRPPRHFIQFEGETEQQHVLRWNQSLQRAQDLTRIQHLASRVAPAPITTPAPTRPLSCQCLAVNLLRAPRPPPYGL